MTSTDYMKAFRSAKISHDVIHRIDFAYLAEFFRFLGIFVCEDILVEAPGQKADRTEIERNTKFSAQIYVGEKEINPEEEKVLRIPADEYRKLVGELPENTIFLYEMGNVAEIEDRNPSKDIFSRKIIAHLNPERQKTILSGLMGEVLKRAFEMVSYVQPDMNWVESLIEVYVDNQIWLHSMNLQYYPKKESFAMGDAKKAFLSSHDAVKVALKENKEEKVEYIFRYAQLWCEMKTNMACDYGREIRFFLNEKLLERCRKLCEDYPDFTNAKILLGLCYENFRNNAKEALAAFQDAIWDIEKECFSAPVYYWMGKHYEAFPALKDKTRECYLLANASKSKFRTTFKLAILARDEEKYRETIDLFEEIIKKLELKMSMGFADPLELEYLFKSYTQECYAYNKAGRHQEAARAGKKALGIKTDSIAINRYFEVFYAGERLQGQEEGQKVPDSYRSILKERLNPNVAEWVINNPYKSL